MCFGLYGKTTWPISEEVRKKALKGYPRGEKPITSRPGDVIEPELPKAKQEFGKLAKNDDDLLLCSLYPVTGSRFLKWKYNEETMPSEMKPKTLEDAKREQELIQKAISGELMDKVEAPAKPKSARAFDVYIDDEYFKVEVADGSVKSRSRSAVQAASNADESAAAVDDTSALKAPIPGMIVEFKKKIGDEVKSGDTVVVLEAMKMFNNLAANNNGVITGIKFGVGDSVAKGDVLATIE